MSNYNLRRTLCTVQCSHVLYSAVMYCTVQSCTAQCSQSHSAQYISVQSGLVLTCDGACGVFADRAAQDHEAEIAGSGYSAHYERALTAWPRNSERLV